MTAAIVTEDMAGRPYAQPIKRYEETFTVSPTVKVFNVNTSAYAQSAASDFASIPVTADYQYSTTQRQAAYFLFDRNHQDAAGARVIAIWYFTPQSTSDGKPVWDVPTQSPLLADKGNDPVSGLPYIEINATGVTQAPYTRSTEPFEMVKNTMYFVGDNEVASYLFKADMGTAGPERRQGHQGRRRLAQQRLPVLAQHGDARPRSARGHRHLADARARRPLRQLRRAVAHDGQRRQAA